MLSSLSRLSAICREHLLAEKIVVAPSLAIGHQIADAIAHSGTPWVNLRIETIRTLADSVAGFAIASEGLTVLSRAQALALIERACDRVLGTSSYFSALADRPGLHRAIQKSIDDLRHAAVNASDLRSDKFEDAAKARDLAQILDAYNEEMERGGYVDRFSVLARATKLASKRDAIWLVIDDVEMTAAEERFLRAIAEKWETISAATETQPNVAFKRAIGEENEVRAAVRAILDADENFDTSEIVYTARDPYLPLIYELAAEYEVPATFAEGIPSYFTRPGQAALAFLRWIGEGWHAMELRPFAAAHYRILRAALIGWGRDRYLPRIDALIAEEKTEDEPDARYLERAQKAREFVKELLDISAPVGDGDAIDVAATAGVMRDFVRRFGAIRNEVDAMAKQGLDRLFDEIAAVGSSQASRREVTGRLADAVRELHVSASNPRPGFLHVAPVRAGGWAARRRMFVVGLDDNRHPGSGLQDPIILDTEREAIGIPVVGDRPQRTTEQFRRLLGRASSREITLSWSSMGLKDRREQYPSTVLLSMFGEQPKNATKESFVDPQPLSASEWWMYRRFAGDSDRLRDAILAAYPNLAAGAEAEAARDSDAITKWDGQIDAPAEEIDPRLNGKVYSASQLESMAGCPYRYFLQRILRVHVLEDIEYEPDTWLEAHQFGTLLHSVLETTMREIAKSGRKPSLEFLERMRAIADEELNRWRDEVPPPSDAAFERRRKDLHESCEIFLRVEQQHAGDITPVHFELDFNEFDLPLGRGKSVMLRGRIDRIDHDDVRDEWHVWDYKSGSTYQFDQGGQLQCGTKIQHAIYARAVEAAFGGRVTQSGYYFPTGKGAGARMPRECSDKDLRDALNLLFDTIRTGWFPHGSEDACSFCDFPEICRGADRAAERTERKLNANPSEPAVEAWLKLQEIK